MTVESPEAQCGTYGAFQAHKKAGTEVCDDCRAAYNAYMAQWRARNPQARARKSAGDSVRSKALRILGRRHADELDEIIAGLQQELSSTSDRKVA